MAALRGTRAHFSPGSMEYSYFTCLGVPEAKFLYARSGTITLPVEKNITPSPEVVLHCLPPDITNRKRESMTAMPAGPRSCNVSIVGTSRMIEHGSVLYYLWHRNNKSYYNRSNFGLRSVLINSRVLYNIARCNCKEIHK